MKHFYRLQDESLNYRYRSQGGSLPPDDPTYVERQADRDLLESLIAGEFCYILNARQMGKSSLYGRAIQQLKQNDVVCIVIDLSNIERQIDSSQWYKIIAHKIMSELEVPQQINWREWWQDNNFLSPMQRLNDLIETIIFPAISQKIVIFIDEIDMVLSLQFSTDDLFAFIRSCYNARAYKSDYDRLTFCLIGVASPSQLMRDKERTPFNIGRAIELTGLTLENAIIALTPGLQGKVKDPKAALGVILEWTGGQPFLTQKICHLIFQQKYCLDIDKLIYLSIIEEWEQYDEPIHFRHIRNRITNSQNQEDILKLYRQIVDRGSIPVDESERQLELRLLGLVKNENGHLKVFNKIYKEIFDLKWIRNKLVNIQSKKIKSLPKPMIFIFQLLGDFGSKKIGLGLVSIILFISVNIVRDTLFPQKSSHLIEVKGESVDNHPPKSDLIKAIAFSPDGKSIVSGSNYGTVVIWRVKDGKSQTIVEVDSEIRNYIFNTTHPNRLNILSVAISLDGQMLAFGDYNEVKLWVDNQGVLDFSDHASRVWSMDFSPDNRILAAVGGDLNSENHVIQLRDIETRKILQSLVGHEGQVRSIDFDSHGKIMVSSSDDKTIKIWDIETGEILKNLTEHKLPSASVQFSPDNKKIASGSRDDTVKIWDVETGELLQILTAHNHDVESISFSPDGKTLASGSRDRTIKIWDVETGELLRTLTGHSDGVLSISYSPNGQILASGSEDCTIKIWNPRTGKEIRTLSEPCDRTPTNR
ncbi:MAG: AAA-like domain-containing protein [Cyanobacteria bacterium P01_E01_bin.42]